ncbi:MULTISPECIES: hypothetical protein [Haloarcula]|uniref:phage NrS-1 polymerase family protein n=1 Tax=Haloarcula TaxID=2237 RepID=UPI003743DCC0
MTIGWSSDMVFVKQLHYWCKGDQQLMDECFRASGRMRPKWDEVHSSDGATYGEVTIWKVCRTNSDTFEGGTWREDRCSRVWSLHTPPVLSRR